MTKKKPKKVLSNVSPEQFVKVWQSSSTIDEVMLKTNMKRNTVYGRVNSYRKKKVSLKTMKRPHKKLDIDGLNAIAAAHLTKK